jgi:hypothetical protein
MMPIPSVIPPQRSTPQPTRPPVHSGNSRPRPGPAIPPVRACPPRPRPDQRDESTPIGLRRRHWRLPGHPVARSIPAYPDHRLTDGPGQLSGRDRDRAASGSRRAGHAQGASCMVVGFVRSVAPRTALRQRGPLSADNRARTPRNTGGAPPARRQASHRLDTVSLRPGRSGYASRPKGRWIPGFRPEGSVTSCKDVPCAPYTA